MSTAMEIAAKELESLISLANSNKPAIEKLKSELMQREINIMYPPEPLVPAKPDGTDQSVVIQAIIDNFPDGATIFVPEGVFVASLKVHSNISIKGAGRNNSVLKAPSGSNMPVIDNKNHADGANVNIEIRDITIDGNKDTMTEDVEQSSAIRFRGVDGLVISDCNIINGYRYNIFMGYCRNVTIKGNYVDGNGTSASVVAAGDGVRFAGRITIDNNTITNSAMDAIIANVSNVNITNNRIENTGLASLAAGIYMTNTSRNNKIIGNYVTNASIGIDLNGAKDIEVIGNTCTFNKKGGIWAYNGAKNIKIIGNTCSNNNQLGETYGGIGVTQSGTEYCVIEGNVCYDDQETPTQHYGLYLAGSDFNVVRGNVTFGNSINHFYITNNENSDLHFLTSRSEIRNNTTISGESYSGAKGRNILTLNGSSDNNHIQVTSNKERVKFANASGASTMLQFSFYRGSSSGRPTNAVIGEAYFDTTLGKPIWFNGTNWVDATGATV